MKPSPDTDHICEPGGFYANICQACRIDIANGHDARFASPTPGGMTALKNREDAAARRLVLGGNSDPTLRAEDVTVRPPVDVAVSRGVIPAVDRYHLRRRP